MELTVGSTVSINGYNITIENADSDTFSGITSEGEKVYGILADADNDEFVTASNPARARDALRNYYFTHTTMGQKIDDFVRENPLDQQRHVDEWVEIFHDLTGACAYGSFEFLRDNGIKRYNMYTTAQFLDIVKHAYNSEIIEKIKERYSIGE